MIPIRLARAWLDVKCTLLGHRWSGWVDSSCRPHGCRYCDRCGFTTHS